MAAKPGDLLIFARGELLRWIEGASARVWLAAPYLSVPIAEYVARAVSRSSANDRRLLTALNRGSVAAGVLDPKALLILLECGFEIASRQNLHAKVSLIDQGWGLVGSGNLTNAGLGSSSRGNAELGVVLNAAQIAEVNGIFTSWWGKAARLSKATIEAADKWERIPKSWKGDKAYGASVEVPDTEALAEILLEGPADTLSRRYWLKSAYHDPARPDWWHRAWISDSDPEPRYKEGDLIFLYLGKKNGGPQRCPAVVRAVAESRLDRNWVIEHRDEAAADQWPWVTETSFVAEVPFAHGAMLKSIGKSGHSLRRGNCSISREQFEVLARELCEASGR